ncbi:MAG: RNA methyltransferase [Rhodothermales bacterium]|nr:RNA methyltransferase [Rhodothermales bacterium]
MEQALERYRALQPDWTAFVGACRRPLELTGWYHPGRPDYGLAAADGFDSEPLHWRPGAFRANAAPPMTQSLAYRAGLLHIQEEASMLPVRLLGPKPGERILDLCAAPGNKTAEIALALGGRGTVVANDLIAGRLNVVRTTRDRLGLPNVATTQVDGCSNAWPDAHFDAVLVDAPCSCEGTLRRHPRAITRSRAADRTRLAATQTALLRNALRMVRPGGRVVYATCTFAPEENEEVVTDALRGQTDILVEHPGELAGLPFSEGLRSWQGQAFHPNMDRAVRLWPGKADTGGFFAVLLRREGPHEPGEMAPGREGPHEPTELARNGDLADQPPPPPAEVPRPHELQRVLDFLTDSFGLPDAWTRDWRFRLRGRSIDITPSDHVPDLPFPVDPRGFSLVRVNARVPKLSTQGALWMGSLATQQVVELTRDQAWSFVRGESVGGAWPTAGFGYTIIRHQGVTLGVGLYRPERNELESQYPRHWAGLNTPVGG